MGDDMTTEADDLAADATMLARLRSLWERTDPVPDGLAERMVAAVVIEDRSREWTLLPLVDGAELGAVRGEADTLTLRFSDGTTSVLLHVTATEDGQRRVDGWTDAAALELRLSQGRKEWAARPSATGRFAFDAITTGQSRLWLVRSDEGEIRAFMTPRFEV
jgi:hypothetical protein